MDSGRVPVHICPGPQGDPRYPASQQLTRFHARTGWFHLDFGDGAEADEVFEHAGEGGKVGHGVEDDFITSGEQL